MPWSNWTEFWKALLEGAVTDTVLLIASAALGFLIAWWRQRRVVPRVDIQVRKVSPTPSARVRPKVLVATFSGWSRKPDKMPEEEFRDALRTADLDRLPLDETTRGIGTTVKLLTAYPSLEKVFLLTTRSEKGPSSIDSVPLLRAWAKREGLACEIVAEEKHCLNLEEDTQVTRDAFEATHEIFKSLGRRYKPKGSRVLVDVTGGPRAMSTGALLACLGPHQDAHVIGSRYGDDGQPIKGSAFPMLIQFQPRGARS